MTRSICTEWVAVAGVVVITALIGGCATPASPPASAWPEIPAGYAAICGDLTTPPPSYSGRTYERLALSPPLGGEDLRSKASACPYAILVTPGRSELYLPDRLGPVMVGGKPRKECTRLTLDAEEGKLYVIRFEYVKGQSSPIKEEFFDRNKGKLWVFWIEEAPTRKYVCGWRPPAETGKPGDVP